MPTPIAPFALSRRGLFRLAGATALSAATVATVAACSDEEISGPELDSLTAQLRAARSDAAEVTAASTVIPDYAAALAIVASQRAEHADALDTEIARATGASTDTSTPDTTTSVAPPVPPPPNIAAVREMLTTSARSAAEAARNESGYRAGLLGSISAACTVSAAVVLS